jgi:uncharacterized protein (DUF433 family)
MNWQDRILTDAAICHGKTTVRGTRIMGSVILDNIADGVKPQEIVDDCLQFNCKRFEQQ